jgi:hypothetical protein
MLTGILTVVGLLALRVGVPLIITLAIGEYVLRRRGGGHELAG